MSLKSELTRFTSLQELADFICPKENQQIKIQCQIGRLGGRSFKKTGYSGTFCLNDIVKKVNEFSRNVTNKNSKELESIQKNVSNISHLIKYLDDKANQQLSSQNCFIKLCTKIKRFMCGRFNRQEFDQKISSFLGRVDVLRKQRIIQERIKASVENLGDAVKAAGENTEENQKIDKDCLSKLVYTKNVFSIAKDSNVGFVEAQCVSAYTAFLESQKKSAKSLVNALTPQDDTNKLLYQLLDISQEEENSKYLGELIKYRLAILKQYTNILEKLSPMFFEFSQMVSVVSQTFFQHIQRSDEKLFQHGISRLIGSRRFYARVEKEKLYLLLGLGTIISNGNSCVSRVREITSLSSYILKVSYDKNLIDSEARVLRDIHKNGIKPGVQAPLYTTFHIDKVIVYDNEGRGEDKEFNATASLNKLYVYGNLRIRIVDIKPNESIRITYCKKVILAFQSKCEAGYWHGDIKLENFFVDLDDEVYLADWEGAKSYTEVVAKFSAPNRFTKRYCNRSDILARREAIAKKNATKLLQVAESWDLYSLAISLYMILTHYNPYPLKKDPETGYKLPDPESPLNKTELRNYGDRVVNTLSKMLEHDREKRPTWAQVREELNAFSAADISSG